MPQHPTLRLSDNTPGPRPAPHRWVAPALLGAVAGVLLFSAWIFAPGWERAFRSDNSPASWLSTEALEVVAEALVLAVLLRQPGVR